MFRPPLVSKEDCTAAPLPSFTLFFSNDHVMTAAHHQGLTEPLVQI